MRTITLQDFQNNLNSFNKSLKSEEYILLTDNENAIGLFSSFTDELFKQGFVQWIGIKSYHSGDLSLQQLSNLLRTDLDSTIKLLNSLNIPIIDYDFNDDLQTLNSL